MKKPRLVIIRGLSGSGKSWLRRLLFGGQSGFSHLEADFYMLDEQGQYRFRPELLTANHARCLAEAERFLNAGQDVVVANTFVTLQQVWPYICIAQQQNAELAILSLYDGGQDDISLYGRNQHSVPLAVIKRQREQWEAIPTEIKVAA